MSCMVLQNKVLVSSAASVVTDWFATDWRLKIGDQVRTIGVVKNTSDVVQVEATFFASAAADVFTVASIGSGVTNTIFNVEGPFPFLRINKSGTAGLARVYGVI